MSSKDDGKRKCFTFIWKLENASYCWHISDQCIVSPLFSVDEFFKTNWKLELYLSIERDHIGFLLKRQDDDSSFEYLQRDYELAFLSLECEVLHSFKDNNTKFKKNGWSGKKNFISRDEVFSTRRSVFLSKEDTLTARCRMWRSLDNFSRDVQFFARTNIVVEKRSFLWRIEHFSTLKSREKRTFVIKSNDNLKNLMSVELFLIGGVICNETIRIKIIPNYENIKISTFQLSIVDDSENTTKCFRDEFWCHDLCSSKDFTLFHTKSELLKNSSFLQNDVLTLYCECEFSFGTTIEEMERIDSDCMAIAKKKFNSHSLDKEKESLVAKGIFFDHFKSLINNSCLSDVKLKTKNQTYPAHKTILGARSPVFKAMFTNNMKENIKDCVDIEDFNEDTVLRMLRFIYSAEVEELNWNSAINLYEAADKYEILNLKDMCSSYLKNNVDKSNACDVLVLSDLHHDDNLKTYVQNFILTLGKDIMNSEEWEHLMKTNLKLAAETMHLLYKK